jgi:hypothetical protein
MVIASCFAHHRPDLMDRMILMGVMQKTRKSWRMILEESLKLMQEPVNSAICLKNNFLAVGDIRVLSNFA